MRAGTHAIWLLFGVLLCGPLTACSGATRLDPGLLRPGDSLGHDVYLAGARTYPVEPMSPTSGRCALRLEHRSSATWTEVFPIAGWRRPARFDNGDIHFADGRRRMKPPAALAPAYDVARATLRRRLTGLTGNQLSTLCTARDKQLPSPHRFWLPGGLALVLLLVALGIRGRSMRGSLAVALAALGALLYTAWPVLQGESFGSQELQRVFSSLQPWAELLRGNDGDARHPAGLYVAYGPAARLTGTVHGLRLFGFALLALVFATWLVARWERCPGEALVGLALLVHPILLKNSLEVGPYAFYVAGLLGLWLVVGGRPQVSRLRFVVGLALVAALCAVNHVATVVAPAVLLTAVIRSRGGVSRAELVVRLAAVVLVVLPFGVALASALGGEPALRQAASRTPELAWGSRSFWMLAEGLFKSVFVGPLVVVIVVLGGWLGWTSRRTHWDGLALMVLAGLTLLALAGLSPWLRVQPYYALYGLVPLLLGLGRLVASVRLQGVRVALGLLCFGVVLLSLVRLGPALARRQAAPRPAAAVARAAAKVARACPTLLSATNDLTLPLMPHLTDLRRAGRSRSTPKLGGTPDSRSWRVSTTGLTLLSLYGRHQLPPAHLDHLVKRLTELSRAACVQVLYDRRFPLPRLYGLLLLRCCTTVDRGVYRLFACGPSGGRMPPCPSTR